MTYIPLILFIGVPVFFAMIGKHPVLKKKLTTLIKWLDGKQDVGKFLAYVTLCLTIGVTMGDFIFVNLLSGHLYGLWKGTILSTMIYGITLVIGKGISFNELTREVIEIEAFDGGIKKIYDAKDTLTVTETFELIVLSRLSPIIPDSLITIMWRTTNVPTHLLWSASILGNIPSFMMYTYLGTLVPKPIHILNHTYNIKYDYVILFSLIGIFVTYGSHEIAKYMINNHRAIR